MLMSAVVAVALGLAPVKEWSAPQLVEVDQKIAAQIGRYKQHAGKDGTTHVYGCDRHGRIYDLSIDSKGHVEGHVGAWDVSFDAAAPA